MIFFTRCSSAPFCTLARITLGFIPCINWSHLFPPRMACTNVVLGFVLHLEHSTALQSWSVPALTSRIPSAAAMIPPPPQERTTAVGSSSNAKIWFTASAKGRGMGQTQLRWAHRELTVLNPGHRFSCLQFQLIGFPRP